MDVKEYTVRKLGEQLVAAEIHLTDYLGYGTETNVPNGGGRDFCIECLAKHSLAIAQFAQEGIQFFNSDPYFGRVYDEGTMLYKDLPNFDKNKAEKHFESLRALRKEMVSKHLLLSMGIGNTISNHLHGQHVKGM